MNASEIKQFSTALDMFFREPERVKTLYHTNRLKLCPSAMFVMGHIVGETIDVVNFELYNQSVHTARAIYNKENYYRTAIVGDFYNELRMRYLRILQVPQADVCNNESDPTSDEHLSWMLLELGTNTEMSETKKHRWLGYIQGCMTCSEQISVQTERDLTRSMFNGK